MGDTFYKLLIFLAVILMVFGYWLVFYIENKNKKSKRPKKKTVNYLFYSKWHRRYYQSNLTRNGYVKIYKHISSLSLYSMLECRVQAVKFYTVSMGVAILIFLVGSFITRDIISIMLMAGFAIVTQQTLVAKNLDGIRYKLYVELSQCLGSLRETYTIHQNIPDALAYCKKGSLIAKPIDAIYVILTASDSEERFDTFLKSNNMRLIQTLACACYTLNDQGDTVDENNMSSFKQALLLLKNEVDDELEKMKLQKLLFEMLEYLPLAPVAAIRICENFFISNIPGTSIIYNGVIGMIVKFAIIISALLGYYLISTINSPNAVKEDDRSEFILKLLRKRRFQIIVNNVKSKKIKINAKLNNLMREALSKQDVNYIYAEKIVFSTVMFVFSSVAIVFVILSSRSFIYNNVKTLAMDGGQELTREEEQMLFNIDCHVLDQYPREPDKKEIAAMVKGKFPSWYELDVNDQVARIQKKFNNYYSLTFKWWLPLISYAFSVGVWFLPELLLKFRKSLVKAEALEDVLQMQTLIAILMHTNMDTLDIIYWIGKLSQIHKDFLVYCFHDYPSNPEKAIATLRRKSNVPEFQQICEKLNSTINHTTIYESFSDLLADRAHTMRMRKMVIEQTTYAKRRKASPLALAPLFILAIGFIILPLGILGYTEFVSVLGG